MAMRWNCPICSAVVSSYAHTCPNCGDDLTRYQGYEGPSETARAREPRISDDSDSYDDMSHEERMALITQRTEILRRERSANDIEWKRDQAAWSKSRRRDQQTKTWFVVGIIALSLLSAFGGFALLGAGPGPAGLGVLLLIGAPALLFFAWVASIGD